MKSVQLTTHVGADGVLRLELPVEVTDRDVDVVVVMQPRPEAPPDTPEARGWPPGFFERTAGSIPNFPDIEYEGDFEKRESLE